MTITVHVVAADTEEPIAGAEVRSEFGLDDKKTVILQRTDERGVVVLATQAIEVTPKLLVRAPGFVRDSPGDPFIGTGKSARITTMGSVSFTAYGCLTGEKPGGVGGASTWRIMAQGISGPGKSALKKSA